MPTDAAPETPHARNAFPGREETVVARRATYHFHVKLMADVDAALPGFKFELEVGTDKLAGTTAAGGVIDLELPPGAESGKLKVWVDGPEEAPTEWEVKLEDPKPVTDLAGVQQRLNSLGFDCGATDGNPSEPTKQALLDFQSEFGHPNPTGELDAETRAAIDTLYSGTG